MSEQIVQTPYAVGVAGRCEPAWGASATPRLSPAVFSTEGFLPQKVEAVLSGVAFNPTETRFDVAPARRGEPEDYLVLQRRFRPTFFTGFFIDATCFFQAQYGGLKRNECPYNRF